MPVGKHRPEPAQQRRRDDAGQAGQIAGKECVNETAPPAHAGTVGWRQIGPRKSASQPKPLQIVHLGRREAIKAVECHAPGQGLRGLPQEFSGCASQYEKAGRGAGSVHQDPQDGEELRASLNLVQHDEALQGLECRHRFVQTPQAGWIFQVEVVDGRRGHEFPGQRCLAGLPGARHHDDAASPKCCAKPRQEIGPFDHDRTIAP